MCYVRDSIARPAPGAVPRRDDSELVIKTFWNEPDLELAEYDHNLE